MWQCLACGVGNVPASERCKTCGCSCRPNYAEIQSAKKSAGIVDPVDGPTLAELAAGFKAYVTGKPGQLGLASVLFELVLYTVGFLLLIVLFEASKSFGIL